MRLLAANSAVGRGVPADRALELLVAWEGRKNRSGQVRDVAGAVERLRPKMMTVAAVTLSLVPILWSQETGSDVLKRIAAPMVGGLITSAVLTLVVLPAIYSLWKERSLSSRRPAQEVPNIAPDSSQPRPLLERRLSK